jgi:hypothetical protein
MKMEKRGKRLDMTDDKKMSFITPSVRPSFREAISRAERQINKSDILIDGRLDRGLVREVCMIIAEVYMMDPARPIRISGEWLDGYVVQEIFGELGRFHIEAVIDEFCRLDIDIRNKKAYLRTALYNIVFTLDAHYTNRVNHDLSK